jgi:hypothetical protein
MDEINEIKKTTKINTNTNTKINTNTYQMPEPNIYKSFVRIQLVFLPKLLDSQYFFVLLIQLKVESS